MIDVSIILVNYKTHELTTGAIKSILEESSGFSFEIIVVDNSNNTDEFSFLKKSLPSIVTIIDAKANLGFGKANNLGASVAKGKFLYFINTDTELINNAIFELLRFSMNNYPCVVGSNLYTRNLKPNHSFIPYERNVNNIKKNSSIFSILKRKILRKRNDFNYSNKPLEIDGYVCGASLMVPKEVFDMIGGFDKDIFMYAEETLLCYQLHKKHNFKIYNVPSSKIIHYEGGSFSQQTEAQINRMVDGNEVYFRKAYGEEEFIKYLSFMVKHSRMKMILSFYSKKQDKIIYLSYKKRFDGMISRK